ncbi:uncharacterized protein LY89DRAFT_741720 [Mollisia scopiformis]|uniref:Uncharacterized protein n=1 Tax=Mollisia scopiformis TaxID=149040 RepID=A0A132B909_MOLSC|nr:uncharacterized protein LY89DRAFT_741720 [Mollisia scopiformis]KUJ08892.1 hypothetical protein LY89DRAFT_741720 [Mollisia scopiformis]
MVSFTSSLFAVAAALSLVSAAPAADVSARTAPAFVAVTLYGAAGASYTTDVYFDEDATYTYNDLSISSVSFDHKLAYCTFYGIDEETAPPVISNGGQVGPPQTIISISCECLE